VREDASSTEAEAFRGDILTLALHAPAEWHQIAPQMHQRPGCNRARERLRNPITRM